jgi:hypothetical protein
MRFYFEITTGLDRRKEGDGHMDDWAHGQAEKLKKAISDKAAKQALFQEKQRLKREHGNDKWREVLKQLEEQSRLFNAQMEKDVIKTTRSSGTELILEATLDVSPWRFRVKFKSEAGPLEWESENGTPNGKYELVVKDDGTVAFAESEMVPMTHTAEFIARNIIENLLRVISPR